MVGKKFCHFWTTWYNEIHISLYLGGNKFHTVTLVANHGSDIFFELFQPQNYVKYIIS